jgi:cobalamin biosynthesis protein CobD/CbiB
VRFANVTELLLAKKQRMEEEEKAKAEHFQRSIKLAASMCALATGLMMVLWIVGTEQGWW